MKKRHLTLNFKAAFIICVTFIFTHIVPISDASEIEEPKKILLPQKTSPIEKLAISGFKKYTDGRVKNYSWRFLYSDNEESVFSFEDLDVIPRPGSDYFVIVKKSGNVIVMRGR